MKSPRFGYFILGFALGYMLAPTAAHAAGDYGRQLDRLVTAVERISSILERAAK